VILVTGTGRCGTASATRILRDAGLNLSHQGIRHEHVIGSVQRVPADVMASDGDVSFEAAPLVGQLRAKGWRIVLIHRDPAAVVKSWLGLGAFTDRMPETHQDWWASMVRHAPNVHIQPSPVEMAVRFYIDWNRLVLPFAHRVVRVDWVDRNPLSVACGLPIDEVVPWPNVDDGTPDREPFDVFHPGQIRDQVADELGTEFDYR
jgi:hypothetical protein